VTDLIWKRTRMSGFALVSQTPTVKVEAWNQVMKLIASGVVSPIVERTYPLEQAPEALRYLHEERPFGKIVLKLRRHGTINDSRAPVKSPHSCDPRRLLRHNPRNRHIDAEESALRSAGLGCRKIMSCKLDRVCCHLPALSCSTWPPSKKGFRSANRSLD